MKRAVIAIFFLCSAMSTQAQSPYQVAISKINYSTPVVYSISADKNGAPLVTQPGDFVACATRTYGYTVSDSQGDTWSEANAAIFGDINLVFTNTKGGPLNITFTFPSNSYFQAVCALYSGSYALDVAARPAYGPAIPSVDAISFPITPSAAGELIIGYGTNGTTNFDPGVKAAMGFTLEGWANAFLEDQIGTTLGPYTSCLDYSVPVGWIMGVAAFKPIGLPHTATLTWIDTLNPAGTTYNVYRATGQCPSPAFSRIASGLPGSSYVDATIVPNQIYCYEVSAVSGGTESLKSVAVFLPGGVTSLTVR
jgi:hypothetical protein